MTTSGTIGMVLHHKGSTVWTIPADATVFEAIQLLAQKNIGALPVMDAGRLIGIFSERDYTRKVALEGKSSRSTKVRDIISTNIFPVSSEQSIEDCMRLMTDKRLRHLPVIDDGRMVGIVSIGDMVNWTLSAQNAAIDQMENYLAGR